MPGRVGKRGFKKLPNSEEVAVLVDDGSESEIELLDMTDLKNHRNGGLSVVHDGTGSSCCSWFVPLYMVLLTFLLVLLTIFQLYVAYNVQLLRSDVSDITTQVGGLEDDLSSLQVTIEQMNQTHDKELVAVAKGLQKHIDSVGVDIKEFKAKVKALETVQKQQIVDQVKKFNKSLSVIYSFAQEVNDIHQSIAELASTVSSLDGQVKKVKESIGDTATTSEQMSGVVQNVQDTLTVVQGKMDTHEKELSSELAEIHYQLGNMTLEMDSMDWMDQSSLTSFIEMIIANSSNSSISHPPSEVSSDDLANLEEKVDELQIQADSLTANVTSLQKSVSFLESTVQSFNEHPPNGKKVSELENSTNPTGNPSDISPENHGDISTENHGDVSTDTQIKTSPSDDESQNVTSVPGSSKQSAGKQDESVPSTDNQLSEEGPSRVNSSDSTEGADVATVPVIPTPTVASSLVSATDSSAAFAHASHTISDPVDYISTDEMEMPTRSAPKPTSSPSAVDGNEVVTRPNDTDDVEQSEDSNLYAIRFVQDLLRNFLYLDRDGDSLLSADEFSLFSDNSDVFRLLDTDHNGFLTKGELSTIIDNLRLKLNEESEGVDENWNGDQHNTAETDIGDKVEDEEPTHKDDSFN